MADVVAEEPVQKSEIDDKTADGGDAKPKIDERLSFAERWEKRIEHLKSLPRDKEGVTGKVRFYSLSNRFGFIEPDDDKASIYFHQASITASKEAHQSWFRTVNDGAVVKFDIVKTERGPEAVNLRNIDGEPLDEHEKFRLQFVLARIRAHRRKQDALKGNNGEEGEKPKKKSSKKASAKKETDSDNKDEKAEEKKPKKKLRERKSKSSESEKSEDKIEKKKKEENGAELPGDRS